MKHDWMEPSEWPTLSGGEVHVWLAHVENVQSHLNEFGALLSPDERERVARFRFEKHRERSLIARGLLRSLLGRYTGREARSLVFAYNPHGKPVLNDCNIQFNASHSGDYVAFAFTHDGVVGVDIEQIREDMQQHEAIAQRHFAPGEQKQLNALPESERAQAFFHLWTRKEAFVKARGNGLFSGLDQFETALDGSRVITVGGRPTNDWWMSSMPNVPNYAGAVAVNATTCSPRFWKWK